MNTLDEFRALDPVRTLDVETLGRAAVFDELFDVLVASEPEALAEDAEDGSEGWVRSGPRRHIRRSRQLLAAAGALVILVGLVVTGVVERSGPPLSRAITTPWRAAHPLAGAGSFSAQGTRGAWSLVGDIVKQGWQLGTRGPAPGYLSCPTLSACYVTGDGATNSSGPADLDSLYFSDDAGSDWAVLALPDGFQFTTPLSCADAEECAAGGTRAGQPVFISTIDGGHRWTEAPLTTAGELVLVTCASASDCSGVSAPAAIAQELVSGSAASALDPGEAFVRTTDGGQSWSASPLPADEMAGALACPTPDDCVMTGYPNGVRTLAGIVRYTLDGGDTWHSGVLPQGFGFGALSALTCADAQHCVAIGDVVVPNPDECIYRDGALQVPRGDQSYGCSSGATAEVSGVAATADGGATWQLRPLPADAPLPFLSDVSCARALACWFSGTEAVPQGKNGGSAMLLGTTDDGLTWMKATFSVPSGAPNDVGGDAYTGIGDISCPTADACVALGVVDQGSTFAPVYRYQGP